MPCLLVLFSLLYSIPNALAGNTDLSMFSLNGFGTLGLVHSDQDRADFGGDIFKPDGAGHSRPWAYGVDSRLGIQLDVKPNDKLSAVIQVISQHSYDGSYRPRVEWANMAYRFTPNFTVRAGRVVAATFMESETRLVGYTYPWIRPPQEVYGINPLTNMDGIDFHYQLPIGGAFNTFQVTYGETLSKFPNGGETDLEGIITAQYILELGSAAYRIGYTTMELDIDEPQINALFDGFTQFGNSVPGPAGQQALSNEKRFRTVNSRFEIFSLGVKYNPGNWLLRSEWAKTDAHSPTIMSDVTAWYTTVGYRRGVWTPYVTAARVRADKLSTPDISTDGLPPVLIQTATALNQGLDEAINLVAFSQKSYSAGVRWDVAENVNVKLQFEHLRTDAGFSSRLIHIQPDFEPGDTANVFSIAVDFVF